MRIKYELVRILSKFFSRVTHGHGDIDSDGTIENSANEILITNSSGEITTTNKIDKTQVDGIGTLPPIAHRHGNINHAGQVSESNSTINKIVTTDSNNNIKVSDTIPFNKLAINKTDITGLDIPGTDTNTTYTAGTGLSLNGTQFNHSNSISAKTNPAFVKIKYDGQGHITGFTDVEKKDITGLGIPGDDSNTIYSAGAGLTITQENQIKHTNSINKKDNVGFLKFKYDDQGHITGTSNVGINDITALGIPGTDTNTTYSAADGIKNENNVFKHINSINAQNTASFVKVKYDGQGHITGTSNVGIDDITRLGIPAQDTTYSAADGIKKENNVFKHTNSINKKDSVGFFKFKYDNQGHITGTSNVSIDDITALGIPDTDTDTTYSAGDGLELNGTTFKVNNADASSIRHSVTTVPLKAIGRNEVGAGVSITQKLINEMVDARFQELFDFQQVTYRASNSNEILATHWDNSSYIHFIKQGYWCILYGNLKAKTKATNQVERHICGLPQHFTPYVTATFNWLNKGSKSHGKIYTANDSVTNNPSLKFKPITSDIPAGYNIYFNLVYLSNDINNIKPASIPNIININEE